MNCASQARTNLLYQYQELEQIYHASLASSARSLAIVSATPGEGCSSLLAALAQRNLLSGRSTLVVDLNLHRPQIHPFLAQEAVTSAGPATELVQFAEQAFTGIVVKNKAAFLFSLKKPGQLQRNIEHWLTEFDQVLIDTSALNQRNQKNFPAEQVAAACDACILTVLAGQTSATAIERAMDTLNSAQCQLLGCVLNDQYNPRLIDEICREIRRFQKIAPILAAKLQRSMRQFSLFNTEI